MNLLTDYICNNIFLLLTCTYLLFSDAAGLFLSLISLLLFHCIISLSSPNHLSNKKAQYKGHHGTRPRKRKQVAGVSR